MIFIIYIVCIKYTYVRSSVAVRERRTELRASSPRARCIQTFHVRVPYYSCIKYTCNGQGETYLSWTSEHAWMEGYVSKSCMKDLDRPNRGSLEVCRMQFMDSVDLSPQANSMCLRNIDPIGLGPRDHPQR